MKRIVCLLLICLLITGCKSSSGTTQTALALREQLLRAQSCSFDARITADDADQTYTFAMGCQVDAHGNLSFSVTEPESIRDITGNISVDGGKLTYDDTVLGFSLLAQGRISPVSGPWIMIRALRSGYIVSCGDDTIMLRDSYETDAFSVEVRLDEQDWPYWADIYWNERRILAIQVTNFSIS